VPPPGEIDCEDGVSKAVAKQIDAWLTRADEAQPIAFAVFADEVDGDAWHAPGRVC